MDNIGILDILKNFHLISGFRVSIHDTEFNEIYAYPSRLSPYCAAIQQDRENRRLCLETDARVFRKVKETGEVAVYSCPHGLCEAVAPIYNYGILSGYLMMGQVCTDKDKLTPLLQKKLGEGREDAKKIIDSVRQVPPEIINSYISIMTVIAEYVTQTNRLAPRGGDIAPKIQEYLNKNYPSKITLPELSERFGCSQSLIIKTFKKQYGVTVMEALFEIRMKNAANLLLTSPYSVKQIAADCGFPDQNYFSKAFSGRFGLSPTAYRKQGIT